MFASKASLNSLLLTALGIAALASCGGGAGGKSAETPSAATSSAESAAGPGMEVLLCDGQTRTVVPQAAAVRKTTGVAIGLDFVTSAPGYGASRRAPA